MPEVSTVIGYVASVFSIGAFVPQVYKVIKTRDTRSLSTPMWISEVITFSLWTTYGLMLAELPIIITNIACALMSVFILIMNLVSGSTRHKIADAVDPSVG